MQIKPSGHLGECYPILLVLRPANLAQEGTYRPMTLRLKKEPTQDQVIAKMAFNKAT